MPVSNGTGPSTRVRGLLATAFALGVIAALGVLAGASWSATSSSSSQYQYGTKVTICHHTHSTKHPFVTIRVAQASLKGHLHQGDTIGPCSTAKKNAGKKHGKNHSNKGNSSNHSSSNTTTTSSSSTHGHNGGGQGNGHGKGH
jgi:hypothetical protein